MPRNTSVTLGHHFDEYVAAKIAEGRYASVSEVIRAGLRKLEDEETKLQALRTHLQSGEDSPLIDSFDAPEFLAELHKKHLS